MKTVSRISACLCVFAILAVSHAAIADDGPYGAPACRQNVVMIHGNSGSSADFDNTYQALRDAGYTRGELIRVDWGRSDCPLCNDHAGSEEQPVRDALAEGAATSCGGAIDVIAHGMGVTLAAKEIVSLGLADRVDAFVAIGAAARGLNSCGRYPYAMPYPFCGADGLAVGSPFLQWLTGRTIAGRVYSIKSDYDAVVCAAGCNVDGQHTSRLWNEAGTFTFNNLTHKQLLTETTDVQVGLLIR